LLRLLNENLKSAEFNRMRYPDYFNSNQRKTPRNRNSAGLSQSTSGPFVAVLAHLLLIDSSDQELYARIIFDFKRKPNLLEPILARFGGVELPNGGTTSS
jgi:hypothetical protein